MYEHNCNFYCGATTVRQNKGVCLWKLLWFEQNVAKVRCHFSILWTFVIQKPRLDLSTAFQSVTLLFKNSLAWFLFLKNLWKSKCSVWVNEWMNRQELQEKTVLPPKMWNVASFQCVFFPLLLFGKPRQPDLRTSKFLVPEGNGEELNIMFQLEFGLKTLWGKYLVIATFL